MEKNLNIPTHIAIIMDGNGRWAKKRNMPRIFGHRKGSDSVRAIITACAKLKVKYLTLYAFSTENWKRPEKEVGFLMKLLSEFLDKETKTMMKNNVRLMTIGATDEMESVLYKKIQSVIKTTSKNTGLNLILALNYGSRMEITSAVKSIASDIKKKKLKISEINEDLVSQRLFTSGIPDPDMLIRTSGEMRISNFLLWQIAYTEIFVTDVLWPDFGKKSLLLAIKEYSCRERRFGGIKTL